MNGLKKRNLAKLQPQTTQFKFITVPYIYTMSIKSKKFIKNFPAKQ